VVMEKSLITLPTRPLFAHLGRVSGSAGPKSGCKRDGEAGCLCSGTMSL